MNLTAEQLFIKIGMLVMENDVLKAENVELWKKEKAKKEVERKITPETREGEEKEEEEKKEDETIQKQRL